LRFLDRLQPLALLVIRVVLGVIMIAHGSPKVFGGIHGVQKMVSGIGFPWWMAYLVAATELAGGALLLLGLLTRWAALAIFMEMCVAIARVHWSHGLKGQGGYEFPLALAALAFALTFFGAGPISLDSVLSRGGSGAKQK